MGYWFVAGQNPGGSRQVQFMMDSDSDTANLPKMSEPGVKQVPGDVSNLPVGKGSTALSIASGKLFILNSNDQWVELGG